MEILTAALATITVVVSVVDLWKKSWVLVLLSVVLAGILIVLCLESGNTLFVRAWTIVTLFRLVTLGGRLLALRHSS